MPYGSDQPSTRYDQRPVVGALTVTVQKSSPGLMQVIGRLVVAPDGSVSTTVALTASWPSRYTVAVTSNSSPTTDFAGRSPPSTTGKTSATGIRPSARAPAVGGTVFGGSAGFLVAGRRRRLVRLPCFPRAAVAAGVFAVWAVASLTPGTVPK